MGDNMRRPVSGKRFNKYRTIRQSLCFEGLESRVVLSATSAHSHTAAAIIGTISGVVTNDVTGAGVRNDKVALYNASGITVAIAYTNTRGYYQFGITRDGPYVVRQFTPKGYVQTSPTFTNTPPVPDPNETSPFQSPINITTKPINLSTVLQVSYAPANSSGESPVAPEAAAKGDEVGVNPSNADYVTAGGTIYQLAQFHFHSPSETLLHGKSTNMEIHFVNESYEGGTSVLAVFLKLGAHNYALDPILNAMEKVTDMPSVPLSVQGPINLAGLLPKSMQGWFYQGSLTSKPYSGPLNFFVFQQKITLSLSQFKTYVAFAEAIGKHPNARPTQPLSGRLLNLLNNQVVFAGVSEPNEDFSIAPKR